MAGSNLSRVSIVGSNKGLQPFFEGRKKKKKCGGAGRCGESVEAADHLRTRPPVLAAPRRRPYYVTQPRQPRTRPGLRGSDPRGAGIPEPVFPERLMCPCSRVPRAGCQPHCNLRDARSDWLRRSGKKRKTRKTEQRREEGKKGKKEEFNRFRSFDLGCASRCLRLGVVLFSVYLPQIHFLTGSLLRSRQFGKSTLLGAH